MGSKIISEISNINRLGTHCSSTALRTLLNFYGYNCSEDMCLGLGAGLGFAYKTYQNIDYCFITGRNENIEEVCSGILGLHISTGKIDDSEAAWNIVRRYIDENIPVIVQLDMMFLPYIVEKLNLKKSFHFGAHEAIVIGYDLCKNTVLILDYLWNEIQEVSMEDFEKARSSILSPTPPGHGYKAILQGKNNIITKYEIYDAVKINIHKMKEPYGPNMGLSGIKLFRKDVLKWKKFLSNEYKYSYAYMAYVLIEKIGTGGGNFRRMYSRFLREAGDMTGVQEFRKAADIYMGLFKKWRNLASIFYQGSMDIAAGIYDVTENDLLILQQIYEKEEEAIGILNNIIIKGF